MLTPLLKQAFVLHKGLYGYLPEFPVGWDPEYKRLVRKKTISSYLIDGLFLADAIVFCIADAYVLYTHAFVKRRKYFGFNQIFAQTFGLSFCFIIGTIAPMFMYNIDQWIAGINSIYVIEERMTEKTSTTEIIWKSKNTKPDIMGYAACAMVFALGTMAVTNTLIAIHERFDPFAYILDDILPPAEYRELSTIILLNLFRIAILLPSLTELHRILCFLLLNGMIYISSVMSCLKWLHEKAENTEDFLRNYLAYNIAYKYMEYVMPDILLFILTMSFWGLVGTIWICIKGYGKMDTWMYIGMITVAVVALLMNWFALQNLKDGLGLTMDALEKWKKEAKANYFEERTRKSKAILKRLEATTQISVVYGPFFKLEKNYVMSFFHNLTQREVDTVLMVDKM
ncbi:unnamed protein product [Orchesella dallaii]|uniref:Gustatory receptor n=1 Tax=Orchesella dallaii TaxID=48710 RepID=A0ABP1RDB6_9HEXA